MSVSTAAGYVVSNVRERHLWSDLLLLGWNLDLPAVTNIVSFLGLRAPEGAESYSPITGTYI